MHEVNAGLASQPLRFANKGGSKGVTLRFYLRGHIQTFLEKINVIMTLGGEGV